MKSVDTEFQPETQFPFWEQLTESQKRIVASNIVSRRFEQGQLIYSTDASCLGMILVRSGELRVYVVSEEGREITLFRLNQGETCVLSASCVVDAITFDTQIEATRDTELFTLRSSTLDVLAAENVYVRCFVYEVLCERFSSTMWTLQAILFHGFDKRLAEFLLAEYDRTKSPEIRMTQEQIAQHTNSAREMVARMLKRFATEGFLEVKRGTIQLKNPKKLRSLL